MFAPQGGRAHRRRTRERKRQKGDRARSRRRRQRHRVSRREEDSPRRALRIRHAQQTEGLCDHALGRQGQKDGVRLSRHRKEARARRAAGLRQRRAASFHGRRRADLPADAPVVGDPQDLHRQDRGRDTGERSRHTAQGRDVRRREVFALQGQAARRGERTEPPRSGRHGGEKP